VIIFILALSITHFELFTLFLITLRIIVGNIPFFDNTNIFVGISLLQLFTLTVILCGIMAFLLRFTITDIINSFSIYPIKWLTAFMIFSVLGLIISKLGFFSVVITWLRLLLFFVIIFVVMNMVKINHQFDKSANTIMTAIIIGSIVPLFIFLLNLATNNWIYDSQGNARIIGASNQHWSEFCMLILFVTPAYLYKIQSSSKHYIRAFYLFGLLTCIVAIFLAGYRTALIGLIILFFIYFMLNKKRLLVYILPLILAFSYFSYKTINYRMRDFTVLFSELPNLNLVSSRYDSLFTGRFGFWRISLNKFFFETSVGEKIFGQGFKASLIEESSGVFTGVHNMTLQLLNETGLLGLALFIGFLFSMFISIFKWRKIIISKEVRVIFNLIISIMGAYLVTSLASNHVLGTDVLLLFGAYVGLAFGIYNVNTNALNRTIRLPQSN